MRLRALALSLLSLFGASDAAAETQYTMLEFADLRGWNDDEHAQALRTFQNTCQDMKDRHWQAPCALAASAPLDARVFFETLFRPVLIEDGNSALFTGYFEPELRGARRRGGKYQTPLFLRPPELDQGKPWLTRREIDQENTLYGRGLDVAWVDDPVDAFFLQIQGSGRVRLANGGSIRLGYADNNGHDYSSVGRELVRRGIFEAHQVSADVIRKWVKDNPQEGRELLWTNESYVFFREVNQVPADKGPLGAMNRSITALRSVAVDPRYVPLGAPVWIEKNGIESLSRLMVAQDTGSAIKGAQRADIFYGTGASAGRRAGVVRDSGRIVVLMPIALAYARVTGS